MKTSSRALALWFFGASILVSGFFTFTCPIDEEEKPMPEVSQNAIVPVLEKVPTTDSTRPSKKEESPPVHDFSVKGEGSFLPIIKRASLRYNIDPALVKAIIMAESEYNPKAVSVKGAMGLMQLMPVTAKYLGVDDLFNPEQNIHAGVRHFKFLLEQFEGDVTLALAAYNAGSTIVKRYKDIPPFKETKRYLKKVMRYYEMYKETG